MKRSIGWCVGAAALLGGCRRDTPVDGETTAASAAPQGGGAPSAAPPAPPPTSPPAPVGDPKVIAEIIEYHNTKSVEAGKITMTGIVQLRVDNITERNRVAHAEYTFEPAKGGRLDAPADPEASTHRWASEGGPSPSPYRWATMKDGVEIITDARTFEYRLESGTWRIKSMGPKQSGSFGADQDGWSDANAMKALTEFYDRRGVWAGQFRLGAVARYRVDRMNEGQKMGYVEYLYIPLPGNNRETSYDKRTFKFEKLRGAWVVTQMGDYMSAANGLAR